MHTHQVRATMTAELGESFDTLMAGVMAGGGSGAVSHDDMRRCFFGDYMDASLEPHERV